MNNKEKMITIDDMNPTFLYTWKGTRHEDEAVYHCHDHLEMAFVLSGKGKYHIEGEIYDIAEGDLLIFNPGIRHQALFLKQADTPTTEFFVGFSDISLPGYCANHLPLPRETYIIHTGGELRQRIFRICSSMEAECAARRAGSYHMLKAYLMQLLILVVREQSRPEEPVDGYAFESTNKKYVVEKMLNYFEEHYSEKISLDQIAGNMYLSPFYVSKIFKSETGDAPIQHLIKIRLEKAKELLESGATGNVQEIAAQVGYEDAYHFSKLFKKRFGITPTQAKKAGIR
ncbi:MAG: helix-turn-helix transcriptional regulator [Lachnospiraceae bacterium]|nr:helix-turn-helix transcriptional regulator [Lachnospiraceae bacterium]